ncbi:MAG: DUF2341 domain-containing protein, partial [Methanoregulaceae archaeon]|nr:DUF2341 domain-containing protein [Methanoregulaceae archaeon]
FTDQSSGSPASWNWSFGDATPNSTLQNPTHTYSGTGNYNVTLTVSNAYGTSSLRKTSYITVTPPPPFLSGWSYRRLHTIAGSSSGDLTDYQIRCTVWNTTGTDSGENVYIGSLVNPDFSDLRFTTTANTLLPYWIQETGSNYAIVWVRIPSIPATGTQMYLYYGNPTASSLSNGDTTFPFFDDFSGSALNTVRWPSSRGTAVSSGTCVLDVSSDSSGSQDLIYATPYTVPINSTLEFRFKPEPASKARAGISDAESLFCNNGMNYLGLQFFSDGYLYTDTNNGNSVTQTKEVPYSAAFQVIAIAWNPGSARFLRDGTLIREYTSNVPTGSDSLHILFRDVQTIDWVFVRNFSSSGPEHSSWNPEDSNFISIEPSQGISRDV